MNEATVQRHHWQNSTQQIHSEMQTAFGAIFTPKAAKLPMNTVAFGDNYYTNHVILLYFII